MQLPILAVILERSEGSLQLQLQLQLQLRLRLRSQLQSQLKLPRPVPASHWPLPVSRRHPERSEGPL